MGRSISSMGRNTFKRNAILTMPNLAPITIDRDQKKRLIKYLAALDKIVKMSPFAKDMTGLDNDELGKMRDDLHNLKMLR